MICDIQKNAECIKRHAEHDKRQKTCVALAILFGGHVEKYLLGA